ncbi:hypothetical protein HPB50_016516 [Hyalomma asiaticum]|uniref:Uncharacterized protein n=1 Tax=Hyalomma asiaticum TaxID=266040 RepID=A0ACB7SWG5_HYAAI|nr:hypothetical protein HPB50_016516 [Hyalomma asiaticum]
MPVAAAAHSTMCGDSSNPCDDSENAKDATCADRSSVQQQQLRTVLPLSGSFVSPPNPLPRRRMPRGEHRRICVPLKYDGALSQ